jgi:chromosome segregation ATPase
MGVMSPIAWPESRTDRQGARWVAGLATLLAALASGCATSPDPHQGGFVSGVAGLAGGGYQRRIDEREGTYRGELDAQSRLKAQAAELERERAQVRGDLTQARSRLASQERHIAAQRARLGAERQRSAAAQAELRRLDLAQSKVAQAKGELRAVRPEDQPVADLKARSADIRRELDEIDSMVGVVGAKAF